MCKYMATCDLRRFLTDIDEACPLGLGSIASPECAAAVVRASHQNSARCIVTPLFEHSPPIADYLCRGDALKTPGVRSLCSEVKWPVHATEGQPPGRSPSHATTAQGGHKGGIVAGIGLGTLGVGALGYGAMKLKASRSEPENIHNTLTPLNYVHDPSEIENVADLIDAHARARFEGAHSPVDSFNDQHTIDRKLYDELVNRRVSEMNSMHENQMSVPQDRHGMALVAATEIDKRRELLRSIIEGRTRTSW